MIVIRSKLSLFLLFAVLSATILPAQGIFAAEKVLVMIPKGSNSGIYLMGQYEVQVADSYGKKRIKDSAMGGIFGMAAPKINAAKKPGEWQRFLIKFKAPRFENRKRIAPAEFVKVALNGEVIHE